MTSNGLTLTLQSQTAIGFLAYAGLRMDTGHPNHTRISVFTATIVSVVQLNFYVSRNLCWFRRPLVVNTGALYFKARDCNITSKLFMPRRSPRSINNLRFSIPIARLNSVPSDLRHCTGIY